MLVSQPASQPVSQSGRRLSFFSCFHIPLLVYVSIDLCVMLWRWRNLLLTYIQWHTLLLQVRVLTHVTTPDHCNSYALKDPKDQAFRSDCAHSHEDRYLLCVVLKGALKRSAGHRVLESAPTAIFATRQGKRHCSRKSMLTGSAKGVSSGMSA